MHSDTSGGGEALGAHATHLGNQFDVFSGVCTGGYSVSESRNHTGQTCEWELWNPCGFHVLLCHILHLCLLTLLWQILCPFCAELHHWWERLNFVAKNWSWTSHLHCVHHGCCCCWDAPPPSRTILKLVPLLLHLLLLIIISIIIIIISTIICARVFAHVHLLASSTVCVDRGMRGVHLSWADGVFLGSSSWLNAQSGECLVPQHRGNRQFHQLPVSVYCHQDHLQWEWGLDWEQFEPKPYGLFLLASCSSQYCQPCCLHPLCIMLYLQEQCQQKFLTIWIVLICKNNNNSSYTSRAQAYSSCRFFWFQWSSQPNTLYRCSSSSSWHWHVTIRRLQGTHLDKKLSKKIL